MERTKQLDKLKFSNSQFQVKHQIKIAFAVPHLTFNITGHKVSDGMQSAYRDTRESQRLAVNMIFSQVTVSNEEMHCY